MNGRFTQMTSTRRPHDLEISSTAKALRVSRPGSSRTQDTPELLIERGHSQWWVEPCRVPKRTSSVLQGATNSQDGATLLITTTALFSYTIVFLPPEITFYSGHEKQSRCSPLSSCDPQSKSLVRFRCTSPSRFAGQSHHNTPCTSDGADRLFLRPPPTNTRLAAPRPGPWDKA
ncbi:hypothetical protein M3J09_013412 [Ascochyta lentis]